MQNKIRLDNFLTEKKLTDSRNKAQAIIMAGKVKVNNQIITKSGFFVKPEDEIIIEKINEWAGRGAEKLLKAFKVFNLNVKGKICADFGASTGGFTDVLLSNGAEKIYAIDVGYGQLIWRLANNPKVIVMDRTNARYLTLENFQEKIDLSVCDVSFISLRLILPVIDEISDEAVVLIKPQFEAGREKVSHGVIKDEKIHSEVLKNISNFIHEHTNFFISGITHSPIKGPEGNIEFLCWLKKSDTGFNFIPEEISDIAHNELD